MPVVCLVAMDLTEHKRLEEALRQLNVQLEKRVQDRTAELVKVNETLRAEIVERKRSEEALRQSEARYRLLFENMINGFAYHKMVLDDHGKPIDYIILDVNDAFAEMTGLKKEDVIGKRITDVLPGIEKEPADWIGTYGRVAVTGEPIRFENYSAILKRWYSVSAYSSEKGYFTSVFEDITARRQKEERLRQSEAKFRVLAEDSYDMEFWIDPEGHYIFASPSCKRITGYDSQEFIEHPELRRIIVHPEDLEMFDRHVQEEGLASYELDYRIVRADGSIRWISHACRGIFDEEGRSLGIRGSNRDITERKHLEMLSEVSNHINLIINSTLDFDEIMNRAVTEACKAMGAESAAISLRKKGGWSVAYAQGFPQEIIGAEISDEENPHAVLAINTKEIVAINDAFSDGRVNIEQMRKYSIRSVMVIPLVIKDEVIGALFLNYHSAPTTFTKTQTDFAEKLGYSLALALENAKLLKTEKKGKERFQLLSDTASRLLGTDNPQGIVNELCQRVMAHLDCHAFFNYLVDEEKQRLHLNACSGIPERTAKEIEWLDYGVAVCGCAARDACRIVAEDIPNTPDLRTELVKSFGIKAYACHPLLSAGRVIGTLSFGTRTRTTFTEEDLSLMKTVADQAATAMERIRLIREIEHARNELERRVLVRTEELNMAKESLEAERKLFYDVLETLPAYVVLLTRDYHAAFANRTFRERFGESQGLRCFEFLFGRSEPCEVCETYSVLKTMEPHAWEWRGPDGCDYSVFDYPFTDVDGSTLILEMGIDVTERKRAEEALRNASLYTRNLIEASLDPLVTISADGKIMDVNGATEVTTGVSRDQLIGTDFSDYFTEPEKAREGYQRVFQEGFVRDYPLSILHRLGRVTDVLYNATVYRNEAGDVQGVFAAARDVTELKRAEAELRTKEAQIRFFASQCLTAQETERRRIAAELHDSIVASLASAKFRVETLVQQMKPEGGSLGSMNDIASTIGKIINDIRRIMADLRPSVLDDLGVIPAITWFCREFQQTYSHLCVEKQIVAEEHEVPDSLKTQIFRIAQEAMNNVAKHSKASLVNLLLQKEGERILLSVQDNGQGFDPEKVKKGMGLSNIRERAELSGGACELQSTMGKGTTVRVWWPIQAGNVA